MSNTFTTNKKHCHTGLLRQLNEVDVANKHKRESRSMQILTNKPFQDLINKKLADWKASKISIHQWVHQTCWQKKVMVAMLIKYAIQDPDKDFLDSVWHNIINMFIRQESTIRARTLIDPTHYHEVYKNGRKWCVDGTIQHNEVLDKAAIEFQTMLRQQRDKRICEYAGHYKPLIETLKQFHAKCTMMTQHNQHVQYHEWLAELFTILNAAPRVFLNQYRLQCTDVK